MQARSDIQIISSVFADPVITAEFGKLAAIVAVGPDINKV
jgi:hypothetical protein